jgi:2-oxo-4-hydroxy-4-carboxy-5-ureidoimidazoline decarboxylase
MKPSIDDINALSQGAFVSTFGDIAEHSPWVAETAEMLRPFASKAAMIDAFQRAIRTARGDAQLHLLRAHPDLAGRAAIAGDIADESKKEQAGAGLDRLTPDEFARFHAFNERYKATFGFPFIFAVRGATKDMVLASFAARIDGAREEEFLTALAQVCRIVRFRLEDRVADD